MRLRKRYLWPAAVLSVAIAVLPAVAGSAGPSIEAVNKPGGGFYGEETHAWSPTTATVSAGGTVTLSNHTAIEHGVHWIGPPETPACSSEIPVGTTSATKGANWSGTCTFTKPGTYTFYCTVHGPEMTGTITVTNGEPTVSTGAATTVTEHEATLRGTVNPNGKATKYFFKWGTTASYGQVTSMQSAGEGTTGVPASATLKGLASGTTYHFRLVAENEKGPAEGADETFTTASPPPPPGPPTTTTGEATSVSDTEETLKGMVNPDGEATKYVFDYGTGTGYGQHSAELTLTASDHTSHAVSATLTGLAPGTTYHFRLVAENEKGPAEGADREFKTSLTTTTTTTTTPPTITPLVTTPPPKSEEAPPSGPPLLGGPSLRSNQHGTSVHGSLDVSRSGAGGRLEVDLFATGASLAKVHRPSKVRIGRFLRASVQAGVVSFAVPLTARGRTALRRHRRLTLTVQIVLTPLAGAHANVTRSVVLRGA